MRLEGASAAQGGDCRVVSTPQVHESLPVSSSEDPATLNRLVGALRVSEPASHSAKTSMHALPSDMRPHDWRDSDARASMDGSLDRGQLK